MNFNTLLLVLEDGDPFKYVASGPAGYRTDTGISNPQKPEYLDRGPGDIGTYIETDIHRFLRAALLVTVSDTETGPKAVQLLSDFASIWHEYVAAQGHARRLQRDLEKIKSEESSVGQKAFRNQDDLSKYKKQKFRGQNLKDTSNRSAKYAKKLAEDAEKYETLAGEYRVQAEAAAEPTIAALQPLMQKSAVNFVKTLQSSKANTFKSLDQLELRTNDEATKKAIQYLKDIYKGEDAFKPLVKFATVEKENGKNPVVRLLTVFKTVIDAMQRKGLVGSPAKTFDYMVGQTSQTQAMAEPSAGRSALRKKDPNIAKVIAALRRGNFGDAKAALNQTSLTSDQKTNIQADIDKFEAGELTEAEVVRQFYQM